MLPLNSPGFTGGVFVGGLLAFFVFDYFAIKPVILWSYIVSLRVDHLVTLQCSIFLATFPACHYWSIDGPGSLRGCHGNHPAVGRQTTTDDHGVAGRDVQRRGNCPFQV